MSRKCIYLILNTCEDLSNVVNTLSKVVNEYGRKTNYVVVLMYICPNINYHELIREVNKVLANNIYVTIQLFEFYSMNDLIRSVGSIVNCEIEEIYANSPLENVNFKYSLVR